MRNRALQVLVLIVLGTALGLLLTRGWRRTEQAAPVPASASLQPALPPAVTKPPPKVAHTDAPPPRSSFHLPTMRPPLPEPATVLVPRFWLLRGTSAPSYELESDQNFVMSGKGSVLLRSRAQNIPLTVNGTVMQSALADALQGKRIEVSAYLKAENVDRGRVSIWLTAMDSKNVLLASESSLKQFPDIAPLFEAEWTRASFVVDVPSSAAVVNFGVSLAGNGSVWMDDFQLTPVERSVVAATSAALPRQVGQRIEVANAQGALTRPENLDFEETTDVPAPGRETSPEDVTSVRQ